MFMPALWKIAVNLISLCRRLFLVSWSSVLVGCFLANRLQVTTLNLKLYSFPTKIFYFSKFF